MDKEELRAILKKHKKWILGKSGGERAMLVDTDLACADLSCADLSCINLSCSDLTYADLAGADLTEAKLICANLAGADLTGADLTGADLTGTMTKQMIGKSVISVQVDTSRPNKIISYWADLGIWTTGCFQGSLDELREKIEEKHKDNAFLRERYHRVIHFILQEADKDNGRQWR